MFIVDDHKLLAEGVMHLLRSSENLEVAGWVASGEEAINEVETSKPDVILMDIMLKKMTGLEACKWIKERHPDIQIVLLSMEVRKDFLSAGIRCGISGYLHKDIDKETLVEAIETVYRGGQYFTQALTKLVFEDYYNQEKSKDVAGARTGNELTKREQEILALVAQGKSNRMIADLLFISVKTVDTHKSHILEKLDLKNTAELTKYAIKNGIISI